jgi:hypothetical protein
MRAAAVAISMALFFAAGCGATQTGAATPPASSGIRQLVDALRADDPRKAYEMLASDVREGLTFDEFALMWKQSKAERAYQARALEEGLKGDPDLGERSRVTYQDGKTVQMVRESGSWKLESALVTGLYAGQPRDAINVFAEALAARDYERVMRILTNRRREAIRQQVDGFTDSLLRNIDGAIHFIGDDGAELRWEDGDKRYRVVLHKEGDEWRIDDIHIRSVPKVKKQP